MLPNGQLMHWLVENVEGELVVVVFAERAEGGSVEARWKQNANN